MEGKVIIGSRGSDLALWQAYFVKGQLEDLGLEVELNIIKTKGDKIQNLSFDKIEGKGFFTKEIEESLLSGAVDLAVHSHKDLETEPPAGLAIAAVSYREDPSELLLINPASYDASQELGLKKGAIVGTSSARRKSQVLSKRPDVEIKELRGNVPTRINKLKTEGYDAIMLAAAGVDRLKIDLSDIEVLRLDPTYFVPAPAQGVLGLQIRSEDTRMAEIMSHLNHAKVKANIDVERKVLNLFQGGCQLPLGVFCEFDGRYKLWAAKADAWDQPVQRLYMESDTTEGLAQQVVDQFNATPKSVFITTEEVSRYKEINGVVMAGSFVDIEATPATTLPESDWVFLSSRKAARLFIENHAGWLNDKKIGAIGKSTAEIITEAGLKTDFTGYGNDTAQIAAAFNEQLAGESVLLPGSDRSKHIIEEALPQAAVKRYDLYRTHLKASMPPILADVVVFTSPSNVEAYFAQHTYSDSAKYVAIGLTTSKSLTAAGVKNVVCWESSAQGVCDTVNGI